MDFVKFTLIFGLFCLAFTQAYPLSPGSYTDLRFYRILGSRPFPRTSQWFPSKRSLIFPSFFNQGQKRDIDTSSDFDPSDLAIKFGKRSSRPLSARERFWLGKRSSSNFQDYDSAGFHENAAELAVRFGR
uniref:Uncharacterized protein n=1 Tax=Panagrolaimus sp. PS1159 TaxID=55785 RepID=A0AC35F3T0_9BILA